MQNFLRVVFFLTLGLTSVFAQKDIGEVTVSADNKTIPIRVSANTPELNQLAQQAFKAHGRYRTGVSGFTYDIKFTQLTATQVRVEIGKGSSGTVIDSAVATGSSPRNALLRAADIAVEKTNGMGLKGFFTAKLAFIGERTGKKEIYVSDLFLGEAKQITRDNSQALGPRWAPDGSKLLYTSYYKSGFPDIFQIDLGSYQRTTFVSFKGTNSGARYSPNGQKVAMVLSGEGNAEIYVSDAQGRGVSRRTRTDSVEASPCFSPDSSRIVFTSDAAGGPQLYIIPAGGGTMSRVPTNISGYCAEPDWSRGNPNRIAYTMKIGKGYQIAMHDFTKGKSEQVSHAPFDGVEPSWLADGRHLVYTARDRNTSRLCILDTETGKSVPISPTSFGIAMQANVWTPNQ